MARAAPAMGAYSLAMWVRDELGELFSDAEFAAAYGVRGRPGLSPGMGVAPLQESHTPSSFGC